MATGNARESLSIFEGVLQRGVRFTAICAHMTLACAAGARGAGLPPSLLHRKKGRFLPERKERPYRGVGEVKVVAEVGVRSVPDYAPEDAALLCAVGRLVCAWTMLEQSLEAKIAMMREAMGDVRTVGARTRPGMTKLMTELRTMISMRDRRNAAVLMEISDIERDMRRIDRFRSLIIGGFQQPAPGGFTCRDARNNQTHVSLDQLDGEIGSLERVAQRLLAV